MTIGLALSGGGFRAALFNLGTLYRLNDFGLFPKLARVTSVSGGSITSGMLGLRWKDLKFNQNGVATNFEELVAAPLRSFCGNSIDVPSGILGMLTPWSSASEEVAKRYRKHLYGNATLQDLPGADGPRFIFYATNLQTGASFRFSRPYLADYKLGQLLNPLTPLAIAVAASSAFPPFLSPATLETEPAHWQRPQGAYLHPREELRRKIHLTDGGVYDNMGLEAVTKGVGTVLVSDAGAPLDIVEDPPRNWLGHMIRVTNIITDQTRALRKRQLIADIRNGTLKGTYWGIATKINDYPISNAMTQDRPQTAYLSTIRTRLDPFYGWEQGELINWAYALADAAIRSYCPHLGQSPGSWPVREHPL